VSFIDEYAFGDMKSFRAQYTRLTNNDTYAELKARLAPICKRTLRRQVLEYIKYTNRIPITQEFIPTPEEVSLYNLVSDYLRRENLQALPASQRTLMILVLRKLLASSTFAIAGALDTLVRKLKARLRDNEEAKRAAEEELSEDYESLEELQDEWDEEEQPEPLTQEDIEAIEAEICDLEIFRDLAVSITENAKGEALIGALKVGFEKAVSLGAAQKAVIFTESRRTQAYLIRLLEENGYVGKICLFNGSNSDPGSRSIYVNWKELNADSDRVTGSRTADLRSALVDFFKNQADIMIATEAAAEGINLQFCSLVVNYDLPWNPQRIEQRIGRCHRYGQKHDVVVVNFLNRKNAADQRVYELLAEKFQLFSGVFGASDEVLGSIESGVDLEKRIVAIYQNCRTTDEIQHSFDALQAELSMQIDENIQNTRRTLLENFDEEVHEKLRVNLRESRDYLNKYETLLWDLTQYALAPYAEFYEGRHAFMLKRIPFDHVKLPLGPYEMGRDIENAHIYRIGHPVAQHILKLAGEKQLDAARLVFDYTGHALKVSVLEPLVGQSGSLTLCRLTVEAFDTEDYLIFAGFTGAGAPLDCEQCRRLFSIPATVDGVQFSADKRKCLAIAIKTSRDAILKEIGVRNASFFDQEMDKLDHWATDRRTTLKTDLKEMDDQIKELKKQVRHSSNLPEKIELQKKVRTLDKKRDDAWREYDEASKEIESRKDELIDAVEARMKQNITETTLFEIEWDVR
ncbi:MAG: DEAD/DEAH box helicase, partial [Proteobacteria bacterium]|nr:DEAD/DEAH box helicase [Pseudomonadota bacterium]